MPTMSRAEAAFCRGRPWRAFAGHAVLSWSLQGFEPHGDVLEIGAGSGAVAAGSRVRAGPATRRPRRRVRRVVDCATSAAAPGDGARLRMMSVRELRAVVRDLPIDQAILTPGLAGLVRSVSSTQHTTAL